MSLHLRRTSAFLMLSCCIAGCTVSVHKVHAPTTKPNESTYRQIWLRDWSPIVEASAPWNPSGGQPGACDKGGGANNCVHTDEAVLPLLRTLLNDLTVASVPPQYKRANDALLIAINDEGQGLADRVDAIGHNDDAAFTTASNELRAAGSQLFAAYNLFPANDRPTPAEFGPGRHSS